MNGLTVIAGWWRAPADMMTPRARAYLIVAGIRHTTIGACALTVAPSFSSTSLRQLREVMPLWGWGIGMIVIGAACVIAAARASEPLARVSLIVSATTSATWTAGFLAALMAGQLSNPALPVVFAALAAKDLIVCAQPLRSPFERLASTIAPQ